MRAVVTLNRKTLVDSNFVGRMKPPQNPRGPQEWADAAPHPPRGTPAGERQASEASSDPGPQTGHRGQRPRAPDHPDPQVTQETRGRARRPPKEPATGHSRPGAQSQNRPGYPRAGQPQVPDPHMRAMPSPAQAL